MTVAQPPRLLSDRYEIERLLGRGGMASVYLARDLKHDRRVAVKLLDPNLTKSLTGERFVREIAIASRLAHPNVLPVHDSGAVGELLYYVMPYVEGETLRARLARERQLPLADALRLACELCDALDYAHRQGVVHRDIKPENVLLEDGHAVLADFGVARALGGAAGKRITATGVSIGTPAYMSPEQAAGESETDGRSDVYSLACVLYEALAGEPPFTGPTAQSIIAKRMAAAPPRIRVIRPAVPEGVERALLRALDRTPADRYQSARHFAEALAACAADEPHTRGRGARRWLWPAAAALLAAAALAGTARLRPGGRPAGAATVAVLPLANHSADPEHAYLAEGLTDALIAELERAPSVRVVSRMSAMRFARGADDASIDMPGGMTLASADGAGGPPGTSMGAPQSLAETARALGADVLLQGALTRAGDSVRVTATLVRAPSLQRVWQRTFTRHARELFTLQRELAAAIVAGAGRPAAPSAAPAARSYDPAAHEAYLRGSYHQAHWKLPQAVTAFEQAVQRDPSHAPAQAGLSRAYYFLAFFGQAPPSVALAGMRRAATAALESDSLLAEAHGQLALVKMLQEWDWAGAERHFRRALELSPGHAQIRHDYAHFLLGQGRRRESAAQSREALALDPVNPMLVSCLGWHALFDGRHADAQRHAAEANALMPDAWAHVVLGWSLLGRGRADSALAAFREARRLDGSAFTLAALGHAQAVVGREAEARATLRELLARRQREYVSPYDVATIYAGLGARDEAFRWLRQAADERSTFIVHVGWDARFDRVRDDARFVALTRDQLRLPTPRFATLAAEARRGR